MSPGPATTKHNHTHKFTCASNNWPLDVVSDSAYPIVGPSQPKHTFSHTHTRAPTLTLPSQFSALALPVATFHTLVFPSLCTDLRPLRSLDPRPITRLTIQSSLVFFLTCADMQNITHSSGGPHTCGSCRPCSYSSCCLSDTPHPCSQDREPLAQENSQKWSLIRRKDRSGTGNGQANNVEPLLVISLFYRFIPLFS